MLYRGRTAIVAVLAVLAVSAGAAQGTGLLVNASGTYADLGSWIYRTAGGTFGHGPVIVGTNEKLVMPSPSPEPGGAVVGVEIIRHPIDTLGYPMHVALVEKLFAGSYQIDVSASNGGDIWKYDYGDPVTDEQPVTNGRRPPLKVWGPFHADAVPLAQAAEADMPAAFAFAKESLESISNMPEAQKNLANYGVLFIDDGNTVWVEFGPRFAPGEAPHLGCQTQLGRDMVFGYDKKQKGGDVTGKFLQCF